MLLVSNYFTNLLLLVVLLSTYHMTALTTRTTRLAQHQPRRVFPKERKLVMGAVAGLGGAAVGSMAGSALTGPSADEKRKLDRLQSDVEREKQQHTILLMNRGTLIQEIDYLIDRGEEHLRQLATHATGKIHMLNAIIEGANLKQIKSLKRYLHMIS